MRAVTTQVILKTLHKILVIFCISSSKKLQHSHLRSNSSGRVNGVESDANRVMEPVSSFYHPRETRVGRGRKYRGIAKTHGIQFLRKEALPVQIPTHWEWG